MVDFNLTIFKQPSMDFYIRMKFGIYKLLSFSYRIICIPQNSTTIREISGTLLLYLFGETSTILWYILLSIP
jgi:hypothetical protein